MHLTSTQLSLFFLLFMLIACILLAPYNKVEESFNTQALHDFLFLKTKFSDYDHHEFPGVVERTFTGSLALAIAAIPILAALEVLRVSIHAQKLIMLYAVRILMGLLMALSHWRIAQSLPKHPRPLAPRYLLLTAVQFYSVFWTTRMLPNNFALILSNLALASFLRHLHAPHPRHWKRMALCLAAASGIFRAELVVLSGCLFLQEYVWRRIPVLPSLYFIAKVLLCILPVAIWIDSYIWGYWVYPELQGLRFNVWDNQSHHWGVAPVHAYFTMHLPKLLGAATALLPRGARHVPFVLAPALAFVALYSLLPHKEARFIAYAVPYLNVVALHGWSALRAPVLRVLLALTLALTAVFVHVSVWNYPGGACLRGTTPAWLPRHARVHLDTYVAQTGASRFLEHPGLRFSKIEAPGTAAVPGAWDAQLVEWAAFVRGPWRAALCVPCFQGRAPLAAWREQGPFVYGPCACFVSQTLHPENYPMATFEKWVKVNETIIKV